MNYDYDPGYEDHSTSYACSSCSNCYDINQKLDQSGDLLIDIIWQLYGIKDFNREILDKSISELCWLLNVKEPEGEIKVFSAKTHENKIFDFALGISKRLSSGVI